VPETVHVFHDLQDIRTARPRTGDTIDLGTGNLDHVMVTGAGWVLADAKGVGQGRLLVERGRGVPLTPDGQRRPQPWMDERHAYSRAGALVGLTGLKGVLAWVLPDGVDYSALAERTPRCLADGGYVLSVGELAAGGLDAMPELPRPYRAGDPRVVEVLDRLVSPT
jgi:hypothetical protein